MKPMTELANESRLYVRVRYRDPVLVQPLGTHPAMHSFYLLADDLSEGGLRLLSPTVIPVDADLLLDIEVHRAKAPIRAVGRVLWVAKADSGDLWNTGVRFTELSDPDKTRLWELVAELRRSG
ncbi:MAG: PilZ domain-containing protein [Thiohalocapsa sp.]